MPGFYIYTSNYLETLSRQMAGLLAEPSSTPFSPEMVVVHSKGMGQWLATEIARYNGICANTVFPFPNKFLNQLFDMAGVSPKEDAAYNTDTLTFKIMKALPQCTDIPEFAPIKHYLADNDQFKLYQLSEKISETFDQYLIFRPDMIFEWERGQDPQWQAQLWQKISRGSESLHQAAQRKMLLEKIKTVPDNLMGLPHRISFFGISYLPPFHLDVMAALAGILDVHIFLVNPCLEYWGDIVTEKEKKKIKQQYHLKETVDAGLYFETGNPLLASWGTMGREFFNRVQGIEGHIQGHATDLYQDVDDKDMLTAIQSDILHLRDRTLNAISLPQNLKEESKKTDASIQIHSCHSPLREIEVLHNHLLDMFESDPELLPKDILVMAPDIAAYEPFIHAVFAHQANDQQKIPYYVSDRSILRDNTLADGFLLLLDIAKGRFAVTQIMALLDITGIKEKFGLAAQDIGLIENWITDTHIRWGIDAMHKERLGLPDFEENTWKAGFQRLLLGYAMPGNGQQLFEGVLPYDNMEGSETAVLGNFLEFFNRLVLLSEILDREKTLSQWADALNKILEDFFLIQDHQEEEKQTLRRAIADLGGYELASENTEPLGLPVVASFLKQRLSKENTGAGFITGNVTFCTLLPFRSIPAKIVCLIGMNGDAFPRQYFQPGFDLVAQFPRPGDRIKRNDDKYLFLQALISARSRIYISYVGQSNRDNTQLPPCVIVNELIEYMEKGFGIPESDIITRHPLQAFSEEYFKTEASLFSYSAEDYETCLAANGQTEKTKTDQGFITEDLSEPDAEFRVVDMDALGLFYTNPAKYLLENRLGVYLQEESWTLEEEEPFSLDPLSRYQVGQEIVSGAQAGISMDRLGAIQRAMGRLPHGTAGEISFSAERMDAQQYIEKIKSYESDEKLAPLEFSENIDNFTLQGKWVDRYREIYLKSVYANSKAKYLLRVWINHLALCMAGGEGSPQSTVLVCRDITWQFHAVENSRTILKELLLIYWNGLKSPAVFFPETAFVYAEMMLKKRKTASEALQAALSKWAGNNFAPGEADDAYVRLCFPVSRFEAEIQKNCFQETALRVYAPLMEHCEKI